MKLTATLLTAAALAFATLPTFAQEAKPAPAVMAKPAKADPVKGEASFAAACAACHGADGNSAIPANPKLAQQHPEYLVKQLLEFKSGRRRPMCPLHSRLLCLPGGYAGADMDICFALPFGRLL